jgi:hypothetical protein
VALAVFALVSVFGRLRLRRPGEQPGLLIAAAAVATVPEFAKDSTAA